MRSMPLFFDLNLPYTSSSSASAAAGGNRDTRLRSVVTLLELGYSGAAYNLSLRGILSDRDRCAIVPFPLSSLLAAAPSLAASASFHRRLLASGAVPAPGDPAFRQFSRVTVSVDTVAAASSVGSTSAVLRGYDIVAVRPVSQSAFEHVCKFSEADLISIDFSQKVPFRLRQQSVKLAIKRGIFFEITYSQLLSDNANSKRQVLCDAKMLADWTRGKNLIVSSGASNANEVRGPNDVSNLISFLLGLSKERAKAAISDNCRSLLAKALRKKHFYKETIRVERMLANQSDLNPFSVGDWIKWDPLSSGEGDLLSFEEISKVSSSVNPNPSNPNKMKAVDFDSIVQDKPFLLSQHADKLHETEPVFSADREETKADEMQFDDQQSQMKSCYLKDDDIALVLGGSNQSDGILYQKIEAPLKKCSSEKDNSAPVSDEMQLDDQVVLLKECDLENDDVTLVLGGCSKSDGTLHNKIDAPLKGCSFENDNSAPDEMQLEDQVAVSKEFDLNNDSITIVRHGPNRSEETLHNSIESHLKECSFEKDNSAPLSGGYQEELCTETDGTQCNIEVPLSDNSTSFPRGIQGKGCNAPEGVVGICDGTMVVTSINNETMMDESNSSLSKLIDEVYAETKKIDQMKDEKEGEADNVNNSDAIVKTKGVEGDVSNINLIDDEEKKRWKIEENIYVEEEQEREFKIIKLDDSRETVDTTTSTSSCISSMEAVLHDLEGKQDREISNFTQGPSSTSSTKGKRKQKGLPLHQPHTISFKGPFKHMLFRKKSKR